MVVMAELGIADILTEDEHFTQVVWAFKRFHRQKIEKGINGE